MEVARIVLGLEQHDVADEVMHFLDRSGRAQVVATATDERQLAEAVRQLEPDAVVASTTLVGERLNGHPLLALETAETVHSLRSALRAGAAGYFVWPADRQALAEAAARVRPPAQASAPAPVVGVTAARGGAGATFVATHLAAGLARRGVDCLLADLDLGSSALAAAIGVPLDASPASSTDLLALEEELAPSQVRELVWRHPEGFGVAVSPGRAAPPPRVEPEAVERMLSMLAHASSVVVAHLPRDLSELTRAGLGVADRVLVALQLDVASFREARALQEAERLGERMEIVVNQARRGEITPGDVERVFGRPALAIVPFDRAVRTSQDRGRLLPRRGRTGRALDALARRVREDLS